MDNNYYQRKYQIHPRKRIKIPESGKEKSIFMFRHPYPLFFLSVVGLSGFLFYLVKSI